MDNIKLCQNTNHFEMEIVTICFHMNCQQKRLCCQQCMSQFHGDHNERLIQLEQFKEFIENESNYQLIGLNSAIKFDILEQDIASLNHFIEKILKYVEVNKGILILKQYEIPMLETNNIFSNQKLMKFHENPMYLQGHENEVRQVIISQDGSIIVSGSYGQIKVWNTLSNQLIKMIQLDWYVQQIALSSNKQYLAFSDQIQTITLYDLQLNAYLSILKIHENSINILIFSQDNQYLLSGGDDNKLEIWSVVKRKKISQFDTNKSIQMIVISADNTLIACICGDKGQINVWDFETKAKVIEENDTDLYGYGLCSTADLSIIISCGYNGYIKLWKLEELQNKQRTFNLMKSIKATCKVIYRVILTQNEQYFISICNEERKIMIHERESGILVQELHFEDNFLQQLFQESQLDGIHFNIEQYEHIGLLKLYKNYQNLQKT